MKISSESIYKYFQLFIYFVIAEGIVFCTENIVVHIICMCVFSLGAAFIGKFDLLHPYCWLSGFFCIYSIGFPILFYMEYGAIRADYNKTLMEINLLSLFLMLLIISPEIKRYKIEKKQNLDIDLGVLNKILYVGMLGILFIITIFLSGSNYTGKASIYAQGGSLLNASFRIPLILTMLYTLLMLVEWQKNKTISKKGIVITGGVLVILTLYSGERDFVFRFLLVTILMLRYFGVLKIKHLLILIPALTGVLYLSSKYKYYFTTEIINSSSQNFIIDIFKGEFEAPGTNLQILINHNMKGIFGAERILLDVFSPFIPQIQSLTSWFTNQLYYGREVQYGFSLIGEGYVIGGVFGVGVICVVVGLVIKFFYRRCTKNIYWFSAYLYLITVIIYSIRMDLSTIFAAIVKQIGLVLLIVYLFQKFSKHKK